VKAETAAAAWRRRISWHGVISKCGIGGGIAAIWL